MKKIIIENLDNELAHLVSNGKNDIIIYPHEITTILNGRKYLLASLAIYDGYEPVLEAVKIVLNDINKEKIMLKGIKKILLHFQVHTSQEIAKIINGMRVFRSYIHKDADIYLGVTYLDTLPSNHIKLSILI